MRVLLAVLLTGCSGGASPSAPTPPPAAEVPIAVDASRPRQTIEDVGGGNFIHTFAQVTAGLDSIGRVNFEGIRPRHIRLRMALEGWEPQNDDGNPGRAAAGGFQDDGFNRGAFLLAQEAAARGIELTASVWDVPGWMVSNPGSERNRRISPEMYPELAESMGEWLLTARDAYGAEIAYVSFNEADIGVNVALTSSEHAGLIGDVGARLAARGLRTKWLLGDCANMAGCVSYARPIWESASARPYVGVFAFHTWDASAPDSALAALSDFGRSTGLPIRATEGGWDAQLWQRPDQFPTWTNALRLASAYLRVLKLTGASTVLYWQMLGRDYMLNDGANGYPAWLLLRRMQQEVKAGSEIVETSGERGLLHSLGARDGGDFVLYLVNEGTADQPVAVSGLPTGPYRQILSSAAGSDQELASVAGGATVTLTLPKESVTLLTTRR
jgi:O-glycosyl hydrolase